jgi:hypothetical protein
MVDKESCGDVRNCCRVVLGVGAVFPAIIAAAAADTAARCLSLLSTLLALSGGLFVEITKLEGVDEYSAAAVSFLADKKVERAVEGVVWFCGFFS